MIESKEKIIYLVVVSFLAVFAGLAGDLIFKQFLPDNYFVPQLSQIDISSGRPGGSFLIRNAKNVVIEQDNKADDIINTALSGYLAIFKKTDGKQAIASSSDMFFDMSKSIGQGIILTSDGWVATSLTIDKPADLIMFDGNRRSFYVDKTLRDQATGFTFFHVTAKDLTVQKISAGSQVNNGQTVMAVDLHGNSWLSSVVDGASGEQTSMSSDFQAGKIKLLNGPNKDFFGSALYDLSGECVGLIDATGSIKHISQFRAIINSLLKNGSISRPELGVNFIDLSKMYSSKIDGIKNGLLLSDVDSRNAVLKGKAADLAGFKEGDIITSINGEKITNGRNFYNSLQNYLPGDSVSIDYQRKEKVEEVDVLLTTIKSLEVK